MYQVKKTKGCYEVRASFVTGDLWQVSVTFPGNGDRVTETVNMTGEEMRKALLDVTHIGRIYFHKWNSLHAMKHTNINKEFFRSAAQRAISDGLLGRASDIVNLVAWYGTTDAERIYERWASYLTLLFFDGDIPVEVLNPE